MVHSNKVLTVSYGTFSCTLEGFEDSFDTMKAIAEYFRDLAADDRYFGAEPPQPDAEMLARIAQREIARQVEARREGAGIVLRAASANADAAAAPAALAAAEASTAEAEAPEAATPVQEAPAEVVTEAAPEVEADIVPEVAEEIAEADVDAAPERETEAEVAEEPAAPAAEPTEDAVAAFMATPVPETQPIAVEEQAEPVEAAAVPAADSIAAKLQRIRAVVSRNEQAAAPAPTFDEDYVEDQVSETASEHAFAAETARDIAEALKAEDADEAPLVLVTEAEEDIGEQDAASEALFDDLDDEELLAEDEEAAGLTNILAADEEAPQPEAEQKAETAAAHALPPGTLSPEDEADLMRELAEVEAELRGDHARIEEEENGEIASHAEAEELEEDEEEDRLVLVRPAAPVAEQAMREAAEAANSDLSRLMAAADEKLGHPEAASTRETYSHLRAAVAATEAEHSAGGLAPQHPDAAAYRADLARVVHPRRPAVPGGSRRARHSAEEAQKPAPLKLVAAQRVDDLAPEAPARRPGPVRPRRVAATVETPRPTQPAGGSFAEFAAEMGATELPELLEAAAAYMQFVEGREQFTRPQLIHKAREASVEEFNREDGLRSFGLLLREGKIVKKDSGRFVASGEIGFQPASRAAG